MSLPRLDVILSMIVLLTDRSILCERISFRCDEIENGVPLYDGVYCTVSNFYVNYTTQIDCNVYPDDRSTVRVVKFYNSRMMFIPTGLFRYFGEIRDFDISNSEVVDIQRSAFENAKQLIYLTLSHNNLTELEASTFIEAPSLFVIDLSYNQISKINRYAFAEARSLTRLQLNNNRIKHLDSDVFKDQQFIDQIALHDNEIETIDPALFEGNVLLGKITLDNNRIKHLDTIVFSRFKYLEYLQLSHNMISDLNTTMFASSLKSLIISQNNFTEINVGNIQAIEAADNNISAIIGISPDCPLKQLLISNNSLTNIGNITKLNSLEALDLSYNQIGPLNVSTFAKLKKLIHLNLANTQSSNLDFGTFSNQKELKMLDLSYNNLTEINLNIFSGSLLELEKLYIDGNNLTELDGSSILPLILPSLKTLGISNNRFNCTYLSSFLRTLDIQRMKLNIDPDEDHINSTHISGISCNNPKTGTKNLPPIHHDTYSKYLSTENVNAKDSREKLSFLYKHFHQDAALDQDIEIISGLRSKMMDANVHAQLLESNLNTMKVLIVVVCVVAFVFVAFKFANIFMKHRNLLDHNLYRSTTTMNTLQSSIEPVV